jgi:hypothetical protein
VSRNFHLTILFLIGCRRAIGYDCELEEHFANKVLVHSTPAGDRTPSTRYEMSIGLGQMWRELRLGSNLVTRVNRLTARYAYIGFCRPEGDFETSCGDKKDNDCDALVDAQDPDCQLPSGQVPAARGLLSWFLS